MRCLIPPRRRVAIVLSAVAAVALGVGSANACTRLDLTDKDDEIVRNMPNLDRPDTHYAGTGGTRPDTYECPPGQTAFLINMHLAGLTYERDIAYAGMMVPAYSLGPRSPLVIFLHGVRQTGAGVDVSVIPIRNGQLNRNPGVVLASTSGMEHYVQMRVFFRGGAMESVPRTFLGTVELWPEGSAANPFRHSFTLELTIPPVTCTLANATHTLDDVVANDLAVADSTAKPSTFDVAMNCSMANVDVTLTLTDANQPGNTGSDLAPGAGSTAGGVQVQLLRGGLPLQLGQAWSYGFSAKGQQAIPFQARYHRTAGPLVTGVITGEAVLVADYR
ncbi:fimbrial protein [Stenotrophomonas sp. 364]|uniref:fimbrial protein n=1 Tax=Stenotrophomonas sp. 364 TaxID=2691571 RepID=UPI001F1AEA50|nr:fimbrial protein [Stenotrophomonas sp. 364]